jgi:exonuclease SbcC
MRPVRLEMAGFGAYAGREVVDFAVLGPSALFLIHGPTGAGKTTILDAVCFALYGETSGGERDGRQMRSQHAGPETPTEVVLDFALGEAAYRVRRNPDYERPRQRGGGVTQERHAATLWSLEPDGEGGWREKEVLATKATGVAEEVRRRLGLDAQQFRQVVVLPQGQFRKLLSANSDERERILAVLFATDRYEALQKLMRERALELEREAKDLRRREADLLAQAAAEDHGTLDARLDGLRAEGADAAERLERLKAGAHASRAAREAGQSVRARLDELAAAEAELARVEADAPSFEETRGRCERARAAAGLAGDRARSEEAERRARRTAESLAGSARELAQAEAAGVATAARLEAERARSTEREAARREAERLDALAPDVAAAYRAEAEAERLWREDVDATAAVEGFAARLDAASAAAAEAQTAAEEARAAAAALQRLELEARERVRLTTERRQLALEESAVGEQDRAVARMRDLCREAAEGVERQRREVELLDLAFRSGTAAALAGGLVAGEPCLVCGSREHPAPAVAAANVTGEESLKVARRLLQQAERDASEQGTGLARSEERRESLVGQRPAAGRSWVPRRTVRSGSWRPPRRRRGRRSRRPERRRAAWARPRPRSRPRAGVPSSCSANGTACTPRRTAPAPTRSRLGRARKKRPSDCLSSCVASPGRPLPKPRGGTPTLRPRPASRRSSGRWSRPRPRRGPPRRGSRPRGPGGTPARARRPRRRPSGRPRPRRWPRRSPGQASPT